MSSIRVVFPVVEMSSAVDAAALALHRQHTNILESIGFELLTFAAHAYVAKARGGTGEDGITWAPLKVSTILARLRSKAGHIKTKPVAGSKIPKGIPLRPGQKSVIVVKKTVKGNQALFSQLAAAGVKFHDAKTGKVIIGDRARYKAGTILSGTSKAGSKTVKLAPGTYEIGVNTGAQKNSAGPGYTKGDGKGGNIQQVDSTGVTVGFGRSYSAAFDKHRKLFPDVMPVKWVEKLETVAATKGGTIIEETLAQRGMS